MPAISFLPFLQNIPLGTKVITAVLLLASSAGIYVSTLAAQNSPHPGLIGSQLPYLLLVPGESWKYPWVLLTAGFIELSLIELVVSVVSFFFAARYLERIWGFKELCRFSAIVIVGSNLIAFGFSWLMFFIFGTQDALEGLPYHGMSGLQVGFLVAFTQLIPEHQLQLFGKLKLRVKTLPGIYLLVSNVLTFVLGPSPYMLIQFGFFVAWAYLRFFKLSENGDIRGDRSETFAFQYWFPPPVRPYIAMAGNKVFALATKVGLVQSWDEPVGGGAYQALPGPGGARAEAERRRALALKALDARLASGAPAPASGGSSSAAGTAAIPGDEAIPMADLPTEPSASLAAPPPLTTKLSSASTKSSKVPVGDEKDEKLKD